MPRLSVHLGKVTLITPCPIKYTTSGITEGVITESLHGSKMSSLKRTLLVLCEERSVPVTFTYKPYTKVGSSENTLN